MYISVSNYHKVAKGPVIVCMIYTHSEKRPIIELIDITTHIVPEVFQIV